MSVVNIHEYKSDGLACKNVIEPVPIYGNDRYADKYSVEFPVNITAENCMAFFVRADGVTVEIDGDISGRVASVDLPPECYEVGGRYDLTVKLLSGIVEASVLYVAGFVVRTSTGDFIETSGGTYSIDELIYLYDDLRLKGVQISPEFAAEIADCEDPRKLYVLPDGYIYAYMFSEAAGNYFNRLPTSKAEDLVAVYNGKGYKENTRLSVSGGVFEERTETGWCASGLIEATYGDVIRLKNCKFAKTNTAGGSHRGGVFGADASGAFISGATSSMGDITADGSNWQPVYDEDGDNVIQFTIPSNLRNAEYIRIVVQEFNSRSVITVNEEIVEGEGTYAWMNTGHAFVPIDYEPWLRSVAERSQNNTESINALSDRVAELEEGEDTKLPEYWDEAVENAVLEVRSALEAAGKDKSAFLWYHDMHWTDNYKKSPEVLKYLYKNTVINKTFFGGDVLSAENGLDMSALAYAYDWRKAIRDLPNHYSVIGNHDDGNSAETDGNIPEGFIYSMLFAPEEKPHVVYGDGYYYYFDEPAEKTRYIFCDTASRNGNIGNGTLESTKQKIFVNEALVTAPDGWHIVCVAHIWKDMDYSESPPVPMPGFSSGGQELLDMFDAYNARSGEYADCGAKVEFCIGGHTHIDGNFASEGTHIPVILTETDSTLIRSGLNAISGTSTENSVNAIVADYTNRTIKIIRAGRGISRSAYMQ